MISFRRIGLVDQVYDCEELVGVTYIGYLVGQVGLEPTTGRL